MAQGLPLIIPSSDTLAIFLSHLLLLYYPFAFIILFLL